MADNDLCVALGSCPTCPVGCSAEMEAYALCEVNEELGLECQTLECNVAASEIPTTTPAPTEAGGSSTPTEAAAPTEAGSTPTMAPAPTDAGSTPTEAPPTAAGSTPTEAPPTAPTGTPTSMASPTYTKIGAFVAGLLAITALI
jgi:hypothetical protein